MKPKFHCHHCLLHRYGSLCFLYVRGVLQTQPVTSAHRTRPHRTEKPPPNRFVHQTPCHTPVYSAPGYGQKRSGWPPLLFVCLATPAAAPTSPSHGCMARTQPPMGAIGPRRNWCLHTEEIFSAFHTAPKPPAMEPTDMPWPGGALPPPTGAETDGYWEAFPMSRGSVAVEDVAEVAVAPRWA